MNAASDPAERALQMVDEDRVHRDIYRDPEAFVAEMDLIFSRTWVYVAHESEIAEVGDYKSTRIGTQPVIVNRDRQGRIRVMLNRCRHRAATVCQLRSGNATSFRCQYHGWTYDASGDLVGVPFPEGYEHRDRDELGLMQAPRVESYRGLVFASLAADVPPLVDHLGGARPYIDRFLDHLPGHQLVVADQAHRMVFDGNWKLQMENGVDGYHANFTHQSFFALMQQATGEQSRYISSKDEAQSAGPISASLGNGHGLLDQSQAASGVLRQRLRTLQGAPPDEADLTAYFGVPDAEALFNATPGPGFNVAVFPNLQLIGIQIREILPVAVDRTEVVIRPMLGQGAPAAINRLRLRYHELFYGIGGFGQPDDMEMFRRVDAGLDATSDEWLWLDRGRRRERTGPEGSRTGHITDEAPQRGQYARYRELMAAGGEVNG